MAVKLNRFMLCNGILLYFSQICTCNFDTEEGNGVQPALRIFHHTCALKMDEGPCKALKPRFYFDVDARRCLGFEYGGCQGNANNFDTLEECEKMCLVKPDKNPCHLEEEPGPCRGLVPRYFFSPSQGTCQRFFYGGCFGNANNFRTKEACEARCHKKPDTEEPVIDEPVIDTRVAEPVEPPQEPGAAVVSAPDPAEPSTKPSTQPLVSPDVHQPEFCLSRIDKGSCDGSIRRFLYNPRRKRCQAFLYSGCGGNRNNFSSKRLCVRTCMKDQPGRSRIRVKKRNFNILFRSV